MNTLEQFSLLEQKIESAVAKIQQLQAENDALRSKCAELTNALSVKSEQLSDFQANKGIIETGIQKALDRLNSIENSVLKTNVQSPSFIQEPATTVIPDFGNQSFDSMNNLNNEQIEEESEEESEEDENPNGGDFGFDIF